MSIDAPATIQPTPNQRSQDHRTRHSRRRVAKQPYLLVLPALAILAVLVLYPLVVSLWDSVHVDNLEIASHAFTGASNYVHALTDPAFTGASLNTLMYLILATVGSLLGGMVIALWLHSFRRFRALFLTIIVLPWAVPGTVSGVLWSFIFNPTNGLLNAMLTSTHLISHNINWLQSSVSGQIFISASLLWQIVPISSVIFLAGLESIPRPLYEQATVDGASGFAVFGRITLPLLRPAMAIGLLNAGILGISIFDQIYVLSGYAPATISAVVQIYLYAFQGFQFGIAIAASMIVTVGTLLVSIFYLKIVYREVTY
jgi:ABC-type sugar transport system permease subunit